MSVSVNMKRARDDSDNLVGNVITNVIPRERNKGEKGKKLQADGASSEG